jgi:hypothetical protein
LTDFFADRRERATSKGASPRAALPAGATAGHRAAARCFLEHGPRLSRSKFLGHVLCGLLLSLAAASLPTRGDDLPPTGRSAGLEDRLKAGLRVQLPAEEDFVEKVVLLVRTGKLPGKLVDSTYIWAIERRKEYPFPAFEKALRLQAEKLGVRL